MIEEGSGNNICIGCKEEGELDSPISFDEMYIDRAIRRELNEHKVRCLNERCTWTGRFKEYGDHVTTCPFEMISCIKSGCDNTFPRAQLIEHLQKDCPMRVLNCPHCGQETTKVESESHFSQCPSYPVQCQFCERRIPRQQVNDM
ncbi:TNF receptor-associated factor 4-like [Ptychodera flava]|uniref:TNF receptor-associated factor 4-like n=1 Tax=Ptychodera flava TaxID=63121 RepID=UPI00396A4D43